MSILLNFTQAFTQASIASLAGFIGGFQKAHHELVAQVATPMEPVVPQHWDWQGENRNRRSRPPHPECPAQSRRDVLRVGVMIEHADELHLGILSDLRLQVIHYGAHIPAGGLVLANLGDEHGILFCSTFASCLLLVDLMGRKSASAVLVIPPPCRGRDDGRSSSWASACPAPSSVLKCGDRLVEIGFGVTTALIVLCPQDAESIPCPMPPLISTSTPSERVRTCTVTLVEGLLMDNSSSVLLTTVVCRLHKSRTCDTCPHARYGLTVLTG